jgi:hypothetical protein
MAKNLSQLWISSDYFEKQQLQYLVSPEEYIKFTTLKKLYWIQILLS